MSVFIGPAGRHVRSDQILHGGSSGTTIQPPHSRPPQHLSNPLFFNSCVMFPPQQTFPVSKWKESKKSGRNECIKEKADTMNQARGRHTAPGHQAGRRGALEEALVVLLNPCSL